MARPRCLLVAAIVFLLSCTAEIHEGVHGEDLSSCGNHRCGGHETCSTCPADCGSCAPAPDSGAGASDGGPSDAGTATLRPGPRPISQPPGATILTPGSNTIQTIINNAAAGTVFWFRAGIYSMTNGVRLSLKDNQKLVGELGAVLDGNRTQADAIYQSGGTGVEVQNLVVRNFTRFGIGFESAQTGTWNIHHNELTANRIGYRAGSNQWFHDNYLHHNIQYGMAGFLSNHTLIENNESSNDNTSNVSTADQGATKFAAWTNGIIRNNYIHDSQPWGTGNPHSRAAGSALWLDLSATAWGRTVENNLVEGNLVESCHQGGIEIELHTRTNIIRNNLVRNNHGYGVFISSSSGEAYGNTIVTNNATTGSRAIMMHEDLSRFSEAHNGVTGWELHDAYIHDNNCDVRVAVTGAPMAGLLLFNGAGNSYYTSKNNRFEGNSYRVANLGGSYWWWLGVLRGWSAWQSNGQDSGGSIGP